MPDPLFPEDSLPENVEPKTSARELFPEASLATHPSAVFAPLSEQDSAPERQASVTHSIFSEDSLVTPPQPVQVNTPNPLFDAVDLSDPPATPACQEAPAVALSFPETLAPTHDSPLSSLNSLPPLVRPVAAEPSPAFAKPEDPLAEKAWDLLMQAQPTASVSQQAHWKALLGTLFPLTQDGLAKIGQSAVQHAPQVLQEIARETQSFANLDVAAKVQRIADEAKAAQQRPKKGLGGLLSKVEGAIHPFDNQEAYGTIISLTSALHGMSGRSRPTKDLAQTVLEQIKDDLPLLGVLQQMSEGTTSEPWVCRRHDLLLASVQQLQMALQQIENLENQIQSASASLDELRTITLPALGFLSAIQS